MNEIEESKLILSEEEIGKQIENYNNQLSQFNITIEEFNFHYQEQIIKIRENVLKEIIYLLEKYGLNVEVKGSGETISQSIKKGELFNKGSVIKIKLS